MVRLISMTCLNNALSALIRCKASDSEPNFQTRFNKHLTDCFCEVDYGFIRSPNVPYSLNKANRWTVNSEDLLEYKQSTKDVTYTFVDQLVHWDGRGVPIEKCKCRSHRGIKRVLDQVERFFSRVAHRLAQF